MILELHNFVKQKNMNLFTISPLLTIIKVNMSRDNNYVLDLHRLWFESESFVQEEVELELDRFVTPFLRVKPGRSSIRLTIVVGKGIHSHHFIEGKNPLRYYTEIYLQEVGLAWKNADNFHGGQGAIVITI
jgi:hypothetical protein